jgi:hypothetical protein
LQLLHERCLELLYCGDKKASVIGVLYNTKLLQGEKELGMRCRVMTGAQFSSGKFLLFIWTADWNTDDVTLEDISHLISYDMLL